jgi:hypothetical protein
MVVGEGLGGNERGVGLTWIASAVEPATLRVGVDKGERAGAARRVTQTLQPSSPMVMTHAALKPSSTFCWAEVRL